jgi:hypothetical protein
MYPYNFKMGQKIQSHVDGVACDRGFVAHFQVADSAAVAASNTGVHAAITLTDEAQEITTGITNPAVPRNIIVKGNASGAAGNVVITGTNYAGQEITETIALNGSSAVEGSKAFKTVTQIDLPVEVHAGTDTVSIGWGDKLGLPYKLARNTVLAAYLDNVKEGTPQTVTVSTSALESNTVDLSSALNAKVVDIYLIV